MGVAMGVSSRRAFAGSTEHQPGGEPGAGRWPLVAKPTLGPGMYCATLPNLAGPVRLAVTVTPLSERFRVDLLIADRDIGLGYSARLISEAQELRLELRRESRLVATRTLAKAEAGQPLRLVIERGEEGLEARLSDSRSGVEVVSFLDLVPLEGPMAAGCYVVADPAMFRPAPED